MKRSLLLLTLSLCACAPLEIYYKQGVTVERSRQDTTACDVRALRDAPVANQVRQTAPEYVPPGKTCDANGTCTTTPGFFLPGQVYTVDVNRRLRAEITKQCMAAKGYQPVSIPVCPDGLQAPAARTTRLPPLTPQSCVRRNRDGSWQILRRPG